MPKTPIAPDDLAALHESFLKSLPLIQGHAHRRFNHLHGDDREEAVAEVVALAWQAYHPLFTQGRAIEGKRGGIAIFSGKSVASGGRLVGQHPVNDVMSPAGRAGHCVGEPRESEWVDEDSPADQAIVNVDFEAWLESLDDRRREVATALASGYNTADMGRQRGVTRAAIYLVRKDLIASYEKFHGDA